MVVITATLIATPLAFLLTRTKYAKYKWLDIIFMIPFMTTILKNAILNIGNNLEESGATSGGGFFYRMKRITLPLLKENYAIAMLLVFVKTLSEYGTPATFGKKIGFYVFTTDIHRYATTSPIDFGKAASLSSVLVCICMVMWMIQNNVTFNMYPQL